MKKSPFGRRENTQSCNENMAVGLQTLGFRRNTSDTSTIPPLLISKLLLKGLIQRSELHEAPKKLALSGFQISLRLKAPFFDALDVTEVLEHSFRIE